MSLQWDADQAKAMPPMEPCPRKADGGGGRTQPIGLVARAQNDPEQRRRSTGYADCPDFAHGAEGGRLPRQEVSSATSTTTASAVPPARRSAATARFGPVTRRTVGLRPVLAGPDPGIGREAELHHLTTDVGHLDFWKPDGR